MENKLKRSKKFCVYLLDFFTTFLLTLILFGSSIAIYINTDSYKNNQNLIKEKQDELTTLVIKSKLSYLKNDGYLAQVDEVSKDFVIRSTYTKLDESKRNNEYFKDTKIINNNDDSLYFYYETFINNNKNDFKDYSKIMTLEQYKSRLLSEVKNSENNIFIDSGYTYFTDEFTNKMYSYLIDNNEEYFSLYKLVFNAYSSLLEETINQYMELYNPYIDLVNSYNNKIDSFYQIKIYILLVSYAISILIIYLVIPLILKDGRTIFMKLFSIKAISVDKEEFSPIFNLVRSICLFLIYMIIPCISALIILGGYDGLILIFTYFLNVFNLFSLGILSVVLIICSMLFAYFKKDKRQTFSEFASLMIVIPSKEAKTIDVNGQSFEVK